MIFIVGPTSSGKTALALKVCKQFGKEIISADSRQVYKHFDVGTGKVPVNSLGVHVEKYSGYWTFDGVKIHMYDVCDANSLYTVFDYLNDTKDLIGEGKIIVGGTGLYIDNLLGLKKPSPVPPNLKLRAELESKLTSELQQMLPKEILSSLNQSDINNPRRLIRKIEMLNFEKSSAVNETKYTGGNNSTTISTPPSNSHIVILDLPREELFKRIDFWVDEIWDALIVEINTLINLGYENSIPMKGIIYNKVLDFVYQKIPTSEAIQFIKNDLHAYIRRQQTWFKTYSSNNVHKFPSSESAFDYIESVM